MPLLEGGGGASDGGAGGIREAAAVANAVQHGNGRAPREEPPRDIQAIIEKLLAFVKVRTFARGNFGDVGPPGFRAGLIERRERLQRSSELPA
jgi:hypothetical protein